MKKLLLFTASLLLLGGTTSSAQDWKEALKKAATAAADKATDGKLTQYALAGTCKVRDIVEVETQAGVLKYEVLEIQRSN